MANPKNNTRAASQSSMKESCESCQSPIGAETAALQCDWCHNTWSCIGCAGINSRAYGNLKTKDNQLTWFCIPCRAKLSQLREGEAKSKPQDPSIQSMFGTLLEHMKRMEEKLDAKANVSDVRDLTKRVELLEQNRASAQDANIASKGPTGAVETHFSEAKIKTHITEAIDDYREREFRKENIIVFNVPEAEGPEVEDRREEDKITFMDIMTTIKANEATPTEITRLGRPGDKPRPMKIKLSSVSIKRKVLSCCKNLKGSKYEQIGIAQDVSQKVRREQKARRQELSRRKQEGGATLPQNLEAETQADIVVMQPEQATGGAGDLQAASSSQTSEPQEQGTPRKDDAQHHAQGATASS